jgi:hypothetical protein
MATETFNDLREILLKITEENKQMREALEYYADKDRWRDIPMLDRGEMARQILGKGE